MNLFASNLLPGNFSVLVGRFIFACTCLPTNDHIQGLFKVMCRELMIKWQKENYRSKADILEMKPPYQNISYNLSQHKIFSTSVSFLVFRHWHYLWWCFFFLVLVIYVERILPRWLTSLVWEESHVYVSFSDTCICSFQH